MQPSYSEIISDGLCRRNIESTSEYEYLLLSSGQWTRNRSATGYRRRPVRERLLTRQKLSTNTKFPPHHPKIRHNSAQYAMGRHVPGPLHRTRSGRVRTTTHAAYRKERRVVNTEVAYDCPTSRLRGMRHTASGVNLAALPPRLSATAFTLSRLVASVSATT